MRILLLNYRFSAVLQIFEIERYSINFVISSKRSLDILPSTCTIVKFKNPWVRCVSTVSCSFFYAPRIQNSKQYTDRQSKF